jgi:hypothetical protein
MEGVTDMKIIGARIGPGGILFMVSTIDHAQVILGNVKIIYIKLIWLIWMATAPKSGQEDR